MVQHELLMSWKAPEIDVVSTVLLTFKNLLLSAPGGTSPGSFIVFSFTFWFDSIKINTFDIQPCHGVSTAAELSIVSSRCPDLIRVGNDWEIIKLGLISICIEIFFGMLSI